MTQPDVILYDVFAGAGGVSLGAVESGVAKVIAALNHDPVAISSHAANHPETVHFTCDIRKFNLNRLRYLAWETKLKYPNAIVILWGSPDCTHFSRAKSGPKSRDTRSLADELDPIAKVIGAHYVLVENVEEFLTWGPINDEGYPIKERAGEDYRKWVARFAALGYEHQFKILNAADYGAHTSRKRYFGMFNLPHMPAVYPAPTHAKRKLSGDFFSPAREEWRPVAEVLELHNWGKSIFDRRTPHVDRTLRRLISGLKKFASQPQVMTCNTPGYCTPASKPVGAITAAGHKMLVTPMLMTYYSKGKVLSIGDPSPTVTGTDRMCLANAVRWTDWNYRTHQQPGDINEPARTITGSPKGALVSAYLMNDQHGRVGQPLSRPAPVIPAQRENLRLVSAFIVNPQFRSPGSSLLAPAPTVVASHWEHKPGDSDTMKELRDTMRELKIGDVFMRMLLKQELKRIQGFTPDYIIKGTDRHIKKQIGNSVVPKIPMYWLRAIAAANKARNAQQ